MSTRPDASTLTDPVRILVHFADKGAEGAVRVLGDLAYELVRLGVTVTFAAETLGMAAAAAAALRKRGVRTAAVEGRIDNQPASLLTRFRIVVVYADQAATILHALHAAIGRPTGLLIFWHMSLPDRTICSVAVVATPGDKDTIEATGRLARVIHRLAGPTRDSTISGPSVQVCRGLAEKHCRVALRSLLAGTRGACFEVMMSIGGSPFRPAVIVDRPVEFGDPQAMAEGVARVNCRVLELGNEFVIVETVPDGLRISEVFVKADGTGVKVASPRTVTESGINGRLSLSD